MRIGRPSKRRDPRPSRTASIPGRDRLSKLVGWLVAGLGEVLKLGREMLVIPAQIWMLAAELAGGVVLRAWRVALLPALLLGWRALARVRVRRARAHARACGGRRRGRGGDRPRRLAMARPSLDQHRQRRLFRGRGDRAAARDRRRGDRGCAFVGDGPDRRRRDPDRRPRPRRSAAVARLLVLPGAAAVAIALIVDAPKGLDEGPAALAYQGAGRTSSRASGSSSPPARADRLRAAAAPLPAGAGGG